MIDHRAAFDRAGINARYPGLLEQCRGEVHCQLHAGREVRIRFIKSDLPEPGGVTVL
jgi:hypothetical protein